MAYDNPFYIPKAVDYRLFGYNDAANAKEAGLGLGLAIYDQSGVTVGGSNYADS